MEFTTPKGTQLPIMEIKGKPYLQVAHRLVWFREERPTWSIVTTPVTIGQTDATFSAQIKDETGRVIATSHKSESRQGFSDFIEKAETGSIGRALALCGFGTQFCGDELDEGVRLADSPMPFARTAKPMTQPVKQSPIASQPGPSPVKVAAAPAAPPSDLGAYVPVFGKYGKTKSSLRSIPPDDLNGYMNYLIDSAEKDSKPMTPGAKEFCSMASAYLGSIGYGAPEAKLDFDAPNYDDDSHL